MSTSSTKDPKVWARGILHFGIAAVSGICLGMFALHTTAVPVGEGSSARTTPIPQPTNTLTPFERLAKPPVLSSLPDQANRGAEKYWGVCKACHGDHGQGLTDEWRQTGYGMDNNCWARGCHDGSHPESIFEIPQALTIPALAGSGRLGRFATAQELYDFILANMPWWNPGSLSPDDAWGLTAQLLRMNGTWPPDVELSARNASAISVHYLSAQPTDDSLAAGVLAAILLLAGMALVMQTASERKIGLAESGPAGRPSFFHHLHPPTIPALQARWRHTLGLGGLSVFLTFVLVVTGALEMFYYSPSPEQAAVSVEAITYLIPFGGLLRGLHFWSAQALVIVMSLHLLRVVLTGAYSRQRRLNFLIGLGMLVLILLLDFTGYVLRWDEGIRWALVVGTNLLKTVPWIGDGLYQFVVGGPEPGAGALVRFYSWHIFGLTLGLVILIGWHIFRVRRDGGIAAPPPQERNFEQRVTRFELVGREALVMVVAMGILLALVAVFPPPLAAPMGRSVSASESIGRAPWFFLWVQRLLVLGDPFIWGVLTPVLVLTALALLPFLLSAPDESELGTWFPRGNRLAQVFAVGLFAAILILTVLALLPSNPIP